ncbi:MAG: ferritin-like domain-containing protein [Balneolales bacterium]
MAKLESINDLFMHELKDIYHAEQQLVDALPTIGEKISSSELKSTMEMHLGQTKDQVKRLEEVFDKLGQSPQAEKCQAMEGLLDECREIMDQDADSAVMDAALIAAQQKVEHYEIASYGTLVTWAKELDNREVSELLGKTLDEEKQADEKLTQIAKQSANERAMK